MEGGPISPHKIRQGQEGTAIPDEIRSMLGVFELTRRLRYKNPDNPVDIDKSRNETTESAGDHIAMVAYLMHYFLPILERKGIKLNYEQVLDMVLTHDIAEATGSPHFIGIRKTVKEKRQEITDSFALINNKLPQRNGFNIAIGNAYSEYFQQKTPEARFVRALNGLETMLYLLSKTDDVRNQMIKENGYTLEDYQRRIGAFCEPYPPLHEFYKRIEHLFRIKNYFAPSAENKENVDVNPEEMASLLSSLAPKSESRRLNISSENAGLLQLLALKRKLRFGHKPKPINETHDTVAEHTSSLLFLARYFLPALKADRKQKGRDSLSMRIVAETILAHDIPEAITGDVRIIDKTIKDTEKEESAAEDIAQKYAPRAEGFNELFKKRFEHYEENKQRQNLMHTNLTLVKTLDSLEALFQIFDPATRAKIPLIKILPLDQIKEKIGTYCQLFPIIEQHYEALLSISKEEGLFQRPDTLK